MRRTDHSKIVDKAKLLQIKNETARRSSVARRVLGFFVAKGLLYAPDIKPEPCVKIEISDVLYVAEEVEPRVLEVLPAAVLNFPRTFRHLEALPEEVKDIIRKIKANRPLQGRYKGIELEKMKEWARFSLRDRRVRPVGEKKMLHTFRLSPQAGEKLEELSKSRGITKTKCLEDLILGNRSGALG